MAVIENTFAELHRQYEELEEDFKRFKKKSELKYSISERAGFAKLCKEIILPLYDEILRAWSNTGSQDLAYFLKEIKTKLDKNDFVIMDRAFLETLCAYTGRDTLIDSVDVVQSFDTDNIAKVIKDVFNVGLIDRTDSNKIVKYPRVTLYTYKK
jgi:hypothetical protein